ncbi:MAG TPA: hypothetical protein VGE09_03255 [Pseudoxanthomonas sp.]
MDPKEARDEARRLAFKELVDRMGRGGRAKVAQLLDKQPDYISRMLLPPGNKNRKNIGEGVWCELLSKFPELGDPPVAAVVSGRPVGENRGTYGSKGWEDYLQAPAATRAAIDLLLLPKKTRDAIAREHDEILAGIRFLEANAEKVLAARKTA